MTETGILPKKLSIEDSVVSLTFIGGGWGESTIVNVGGRVVIVVDCCSLVMGTSSKTKTTEVLSRILRRSPGASVRMVLLTHPHLDHFSGMHQLVAGYGEHLWRSCLFQGTTEYELAKLFESQERNITRGRTVYKFSRRYGQLLTSHEALARCQRLAVGDRSLIMTLDLEGPSGKKVPFSVSCLAPSDDDCRRFLNEARFSNFVELATSRRGRPAQECNRVSVVVRIEVGDCRIIMGGDAEVDTWRQIVEKYSNDELECNVFKVSHHGSQNGSPDFLLDVLAKRKRGQDTAAIVAPSILHGLPDSVVLEKLRSRFGDVLLTTSKHSVLPDVSRVKAYFPGAREVNPLPRWKTCFRTVVFDSTGRRMHSNWPKWAFPDEAAS